MNKFLIVLVTAISFLGYAHWGVASDLVDTQPVKLWGDLRGRLDDIHHDKQVLVVNDQVYRMALNLKVVDERGKLANRYALKVGQSLSFYATFVPKTQQLVVENIQILK